MPYTNPTPADIKADFPVFSSVDDAVIQRRIDRTPMFVDESWLESDYNWAKSLLTAHFLTEDGFGTGTDAELSAQGLSNVSRLKSGTLDVTFKSAADSGDSDVPEPWGSTSYGRRFWALMRKNKGGPRIAVGGGCGIAGAATDVPWAWRTNGWGM